MEQAASLAGLPCSDAAIQEEPRCNLCAAWRRHTEYCSASYVPHRKDASLPLALRPACAWLLRQRLVGRAAVGTPLLLPLAAALLSLPLLHLPGVLMAPCCVP